MDTTIQEQRETTSITPLQKLINLHVDYPNPMYKNGHIVVGAALIKKEVKSFDDYLKLCNSWGISHYDKLAKEVFTPVTVKAVSIDMSDLPDDWCIECNATAKPSCEHH